MESVHCSDVVRRLHLYYLPFVLLARARSILEELCDRTRNLVLHYASSLMRHYMNHISTKHHRHYITLQPLPDLPATSFPSLFPLHPPRQGLAAPLSPLQS